MKKSKGVISIFALLSMMFFLIFIMVAYNNVSQKSKTQVQAEELLVDYYKSKQSATEIISSLRNGSVKSSTQDSLLKESAEKACVTDENANNNRYVCSNGKIYKIQ